MKLIYSYYKQIDFYTLIILETSIKYESILFLRSLTIQLKCLHKLSVSHVPRTHSRIKLKPNCSFWLHLNQHHWHAPTYIEINCWT